MASTIPPGAGGRVVDDAAAAASERALRAIMDEASNMGIVDDVTGAVGNAAGKAKGFFGSALGKGKQFGSYLWGSDKKGQGAKRLGTMAWRGGTRLGAPGVIGYTALSRLIGGGDNTPEVDYASILSGTGANAAQAGDAEFAAWVKEIRDAGAAGTGGGGGGGGAPTGYLTGLSNQAGAANLAAMQRLANVYGQTATSGKARGTASAQTLRDIYGKAATDVQQGSRLAGTTGSALVPVSGALAQLPADINRAGGSMADYLAQNELISAQDAGFLSNLSNEMGNAYANQIARQDQVFQMANAARQRAAASAAAGRNAELKRQAELTALQMEYERAAARGQNTIDPLAAVAAVSQYNGFNDEQRKALKASGITTPEQYAAYTLRTQQPGK